MLSRYDVFERSSHNAAEDGWRAPLAIYQAEEDAWLYI